MTMKKTDSNNDRNLEAGLLGKNKYNQKSIHKIINILSAVPRKHVYK